jgi:16S rRNA (adenine1518-N6/adenine1519-N6)-dimethyltransferase
MSLADLPPLREGLAAAGLMARKSFGQHFLLDLNITRKIVREAGPLAGKAVVEVGPGPGGLTRALLESDADHVLAIEKDPRFVAQLADLASAAPGRLTVVEADALTADEGALLSGAAPDRPVTVVANLPYNVATPLLVKWLTGAFRPHSMTLMFQKEVADRIAAPVNTDAYGRLSVLAQAICETSLVMKLPARAFTPPPKVESAVVRLDRRADGPPPDLLRRLEIVTRAAFGQRRKMLRSSLKPLGGEALLRRADVLPDARAETVPVEDFLRLARLLDEAR